MTCILYTKKVEVMKMSSSVNKVSAVAATALGTVALGAVGASSAEAATVEQTNPETMNVAAATPCSTAVKACVDLNQGLAWLTDGHGKVVYGPIPASGGAPSTPTPRGVQKVSRKVENEWSKPFNAPMPFATYFGPGGNDNGVAFHADAVGVPSNGCVHLNQADAQKFFNHLKPGDTVEIR